MSSAAAKARNATASDLAALPSKARAEVVGGEIVEKASPSFEHADAQAGMVELVRGPFQRGGSGGPGGWWIVTECEIEFETHEVYRPDVAGWRRDRVTQRPSGRPVRIRPDWVCEVLSPSTARNDLVAKFRTLHRCGAPHYWVIDPDRFTLTVHRWRPEGYVVVLSAGRDETVRAEPFEAIDLPLDRVFGEEAGT